MSAPEDSPICSNQHCFRNARDKRPSGRSVEVILILVIRPVVVKFHQAALRDDQARRIVRHLYVENVAATRAHALDAVMCRQTVAGQVSNYVVDCCKQ